MNLDKNYRKMAKRQGSDASDLSEFSKRLSGMNMNEIQLFRRSKNDVIAQTMTPWVDRNISKDTLNSKSN